MSGSELKGVRIGILGGGITGLVSAYYLLRAGADVTVIESQSQVGGLATFFDFGPFSWDKFYHCILTSDAPLLQLIDDLGLSSKLRWTQTNVGFFVDDHLYPMTTTADFLRFPALSLWDKFRLGIGVIRATRIRDGRPLERYLASEWLTRVFGKTNYHKMWGPLLKCKLGSCREKASAAFIWATIARLYSTRNKDSSRKECLGYVQGGYKTVFTRLVDEIRRLGGNILVGAPVREVVANNGVNITFGDGTIHCDYAIATIPSQPFTAIAPQLAADYVQRLRKVEYMGIVCFALLLKRSLSPYYVTNLADDRLPFTGIMEMTNLISRDETSGYHLVYLPKYTAPDDPVFSADEGELWRGHFSALRRVFPDLVESDIQNVFLFREKYVQPLPTLHYSDIVPDMKTNVEGLLLANTTQIINSTLNNNAMVKIARQAVDTVLEQVSAKPTAPVSRMYA